MCIFWRNFRLALKSPLTILASLYPEKFSSSSICSHSVLQKRTRPSYIRPINMFRTTNCKSDGETTDDIANHNSEGDSGFINDQDLSFSGYDISFGNKSHFTVAVEGNIGSGKTTLLEYYQDSTVVDALREPIEQWTNIKGRYNALQALYEDPSRWSFSFNMYAQLTRVQMHMKENEKPIKMLERSLYSTRYCFVENDFRNNTINGMEYAILTSWFDWLVKSQKAEVDLIVYVRADPEVCFERIKRRSRKEEALVPFSLIQNLHTLHEEWLIEHKLAEPPAPVIVLDANKEYSEMKELYEIRRQEILCGCA